MNKNISNNQSSIAIPFKMVVENQLYEHNIIISAYPDDKVTVIRNVYNNTEHNSCEITINRIPIDPFIITGHKHEISLIKQDLLKSFDINGCKIKFIDKENPYNWFELCGCYLLKNDTKTELQIIYRDIMYPFDTHGGFII